MRIISAQPREGMRQPSSSTIFRRNPVRPGLADLAPVGIGVEPVVADHDLALVGDVRDHPGDELQVVHPRELGAVGAVPVADLTPAEGDQLRAKSTAAAAWRAVVSKTGMGLSAALINSGISVQPRMTPCAPRRSSSRMTVM